MKENKILAYLKEENTVVEVVSINFLEKVITYQMENTLKNCDFKNIENIRCVKLTKEHHKIYEKLINKFGDKQIIVAIEELSELAKELCKSLRGKTNIANIIEELADVIIMINQMQMYFKISDEELHQEINYKINRTKERLLEVENEKEN